MSSTWGGKRPGAGRPRGSTRSRARLLTHSVKTKDWVKILKHLTEVALSSDPGSLRAASLLFRYQFGDSLDSAEHSAQEEQMKAALRARFLKNHPEYDAPAKPEVSAFERRLQEELAKPGVNEILCESSVGKLRISRVEPESAGDQNQEHSTHDLPANPEKPAAKNQD